MKSSHKKYVSVYKKHETKKRTSQAALDYLVSWGWILIIIVVALIVLFSLGVFRVSPAPTIISGFSGITMQAAQANSTMMVVKLTNNYNQFINITGITVNINGNTYTSLDCLDSIISTGQSTLCRIPVSISTSSYLSNVQISFTPYKSSIYEVSNGTVSSTLVSGSIPINNQLTYFIEKGLPYGSTFDVNYNTSANSTVVSSTSQKVSFNPPFGNYYFSVPTVTYQGCVSSPSPSSGYHTTGADETIQFTSNCTTTFSETGLPSSQTWQVNFNGTTVTGNTSSSLSIKTDNANNAQVLYTAVAKSDSLVCVSYATPSVRIGGSYTFNAWNCTTTFSESGLPSNDYWNITNYDGYSGSVIPTGSKVSVFQSDISTVSYYPASAAGYPSYTLNCQSTISVQQGSKNAVFNPWTCITTFEESGLPTGSGQYWNASYSSSSGKSAVPNDISITQSGITTVSSFSARIVSDNLDCSSQLSSLQQGSTISIPPWNCTTTFSESGLPSGQEWYATYEGNTVYSTGSTTSIFIEGITNVNSYTAEVYSSNFDCHSYNAPSVLVGSSYAFNAWNCSTTFSESGLPSGDSWQVSYDGVSPNPSNSAPSSIVVTQTDLSNVNNFTASASLTSFSCNSYSNPSISQGGSYKFNAWDCTTTFNESNLPSGQDWYVSYDSISPNPSASTGSSIEIQQKNISSIGSYTAEGYSSNLDCNSYNTPSLTLGSSYTYSSWDCTTTFVDAAKTEYLTQEAASQWTIKLDGVRGSSTSNDIQIHNNDITDIGSYSYGAPFTEGNILCVGPSGSTQVGSTYNLPLNWECYTALVPGTYHIDVIPEFYSPSVIQDISVASTDAPINPNGMNPVAYDPQNNEFFVPEYYENEVAIINNSNDNIINYIAYPEESHPAEAIYENGYVFIINLGNDVSNPYFSINTINSNNQFTSTNTSIKGNASAVGYDADTGYLWITNASSSSAGSIATVLADGSAPYYNALGDPCSKASSGLSLLGSAAFYPQKNEMYLACLDSSGVVKIQPYDAIDGSISGLSKITSATNFLNIPGQITSVYSPNYPYLAIGGGGSPADSANISIDDTNDASEISLPSSFGTIFYDGGTNYLASPGNMLYSVGYQEGSSSSSTRELYYMPADNTSGSTNGISVGNDASGVGGVISSESMTTAFQETGLPTGTTWSVTYAGYTWSSSTNTIIAPVVSGIYSYNIPSVPNTIVGGSYVPFTNNGTASTGETVSVVFTYNNKG